MVVGGAAARPTPRHGLWCGLAVTGDRGNSCSRIPLGRILRVRRGPA